VRRISCIRKAPVSNPVCRTCCLSCVSSRFPSHLLFECHGGTFRRTLTTSFPCPFFPSNGGLPWNNCRNVLLFIHLLVRQINEACSMNWETRNAYRVLEENLSRDSWVGIALGYGLDDRGYRVRFPTRAGDFSLHHRFQNGSGAHLASYPIGTRGSFPGGKAAGAWSWPLISI
jgi:hypothetical protein